MLNNKYLDKLELSHQADNAKTKLRARPHNA